MKDINDLQNYIETELSRFALDLRDEIIKRELVIDNKVVSNSEVENIIDASLELIADTSW